MKTQLISNIFNRIIRIAILSVLLSGCNESTTVTKSGFLTLGNISEITSKGNNYTIAFSPATADIPLNQYFDMDVHIMGPTKQVLVFPLELQIDAGMKAHNHGMNVKPKITVLGKGRFKIEGMLLHMPGDWYLSFVVHRGGMSDKAEVNLVVTP